MVPFLRRRAGRGAEAPRRRSASAAPPALRRRVFPPGSEWLYAKLYTGTATADQVLRDVVAPLVAAHARAPAPPTRWFFIRYGDPDWHLRLRFRGEPARLRRRGPAARSTRPPSRCSPTGAVGKLQLDTYEREVERYGGPAGIELGEQLFAIDSEACLAILESLAGDEGPTPPGASPWPASTGCSTTSGSTSTSATASRATPPTMLRREFGTGDGAAPPPPPTARSATASARSAPAWRSCSIRRAA